MPTITPSGKQIHFDIVGESNKPAIIFLHGIFGKGWDWIDAGFDERLTDYRLILMDLRGHGKSEKYFQPDKYFPDAQAEDILDVMDYLNIETATIWGYSFGGRMAFAFGIKYPQRVNQIIVGGMHPYKVTNVHSRIRERMSVIKKGMQTWVNYLLQNDIPISKYTKEVLLQNNHEALVTIDQSILEWKGFEKGLHDLETSKYPIIIYLGSRDNSYVPLAKKFNNNAEKCTIVLLEGLNHFTAFSNSKEVVSQLSKYLN